MSEILIVHAREILDSRGQPTIEVEVATQAGAIGRAAVPSGASTGAHEATELRDGDAKRFHGKGVQNAIKNVEDIIAPAIEGLDSLDQVAIDQLILSLDSSLQKKNLGANATLGVSLAVAQAAAKELEVPLFQYVGGVNAKRLPIPLMNVINGGQHANNGVDVQEFMIVPICGGSFRESLRAGSEIFQTLKKIIDSDGHSTAVGDEGGFAPALKSNEQALELLVRAIEKSGYRVGEDIGIALDVAATELFSKGHYSWEGRSITAEELSSIYQGWSQKYPLWSIEDGCSEDDWKGWQHLTKTIGNKVQLVGDDIFVTNTSRLQRGIDEQVGNALLVKVNQIGTLTETWDAVQLAQNSGYATIMSHRSGETEDVTIADLSVAMNCSQIKTGSLCRGERTAKYNQLLRIEEHLGPAAVFWGNRPPFRGVKR